jgi:4-oxalocrotonate tautomerase
MPVINVNMWEGFDKKVKEKWMRELTNVTVNLLNMPPDKVTVILHDVPQTNWAQAGTVATDPDFLSKSRATEVTNEEN